MEPALDCELAVTTWLAQQLAVRTCTELPADFAVPILRVLDVSGTDDGFKLAAPVFDVDSFHTDYPAVSMLARQAHAAVHALKGQTVAGVIASRVRTVVRPRWLAWADTDIRHFSATYQVWFNRA